MYLSHYLQIRKATQTFLILIHPALYIQLLSFTVFQCNDLHVVNQL